MSFRSWLEVVIFVSVRESAILLLYVNVHLVVLIPLNISIILIVSIVFERSLANRLSAFVEVNCIYPWLQFGFRFRKGLGTCYALFTIFNIVQKL